MAPSVQVSAVAAPHVLLLSRRLAYAPVSAPSVPLLRSGSGRLTRRASVRVRAGAGGGSGGGLRRRPRTMCWAWRRRRRLPRSSARIGASRLANSQEKFLRIKHAYNTLMSSESWSKYASSSSKPADAEEEFDWLGTETSSFLLQQTMISAGASH
ncbi:hypothetical protein ZWY2020_035777 [Hordeum vulgare]|nr:hypothetical protein ZWY2020_035777 [Hordeum vulgare]